MSLRAATALVGFALLAQDAREALGPSHSASTARGPHRLEAEIRRLPAALRPELRGVHPRVFVTNAGIAELQQRSRTTHRDLWQRALRNLTALREAPAPPPAQERRAQNNTAIQLAGAALAYRIEGDPKYLAAARRYLEAALSYEVWGYTYSKPNVDLAAGHLLYGVGWAYDLLHQDLTPAERDRCRAKLGKHARLLAEHYNLKPGRVFSYSQNHVSIPLAGLAVAAWALWDEDPEAPRWSALVRAFYSRILDTYSADGHYYEGFEYWVFTTPWLIHYLDALRHATGEDLFDQPGFRNAHLYALHSVLPNGQDIFDYGDAFEGSETRSRTSPDAARTHPGGKLHSNFNVLYRLAGRFQSDEIQTAASHLEQLGHVNMEDFWSLLWFDPVRKSRNIATIPAFHIFEDSGVLYWRSSWTSGATAFSFKCGPPEGHRAYQLARRYPDWRQETGHSHPDAASLILWANGKYLTGDSGYAGVPRADQHNTILINGQGQADEGKGHNAFAGYPTERLDQIRLSVNRLDSTTFEASCDATGAYPESLRITKLKRTVSKQAAAVEVRDELRASEGAVKPSWLWHADKPELFGGKELRITTDPQLPSRIEPNFLTAAGRPGSVDKGPRSARGARLVFEPRESAPYFAITTRIQLE